MISKEDWEEFVTDKKSHALNVVSDLVADYLYYNRKEDEDLSCAEMDQLIDSGDLTADEIIERFSIELRKKIT